MCYRERGSSTASACESLGPQILELSSPGKPEIFPGLSPTPFRFSIKTFVFVVIKTNTLKTLPSTFHLRQPSLHDHLSLTCSFPFLLSHSVSPFPLLFPHLAQAGLLCLAARGPPDWSAALTSLCRHACFYECWDRTQSSACAQQALHHPQPKLLTISRETIFTFAHLSPTFLGKALELHCLDVNAVLLKYTALNNLQPVHSSS